MAYFGFWLASIYVDSWIVRTISITGESWGLLQVEKHTIVCMKELADAKQSTARCHHLLLVRFGS